jgi:P4 family phage/plasmid primase-like protien
VNIKDAAARLRDRGFAITWIRPGDKRPTRAGWTEQSQEPAQYTEGSNLGILCGRLSGDVVCVDLDSQEAIDKADQFLPPTGMIDGRPGKPRSHRWYRVTDVPLEMTSTAAGGIGGPWLKHFKHAETRRGVIDFLGTGGQAVVPPSRHASGEERVWESDCDPAVVPFADLWDATCKLALACGCRIPGQKPQKPRKVTPQPEDRAAAPDQLDTIPTVPVPASQEECWRLVPVKVRVERARAYLERVPGAVTGKGGHDATLRAVRVVVNDFAVPKNEALLLLRDFNKRCEPMGSEAELLHKLEAAEEGDAEHPKGCKLIDADGSPSTSEAFDDPHRLARSFLAKDVWRYWKQEHWHYIGTHYVAVPEEEVECRLTHHVKEQFDKAYERVLHRAEAQYQTAVAVAQQCNAEPPEFKAPPMAKVKQGLIGDVLQAFKSIAAVPGTVPQPSMLPDGTERNLIALTNGLLDLDSGQLREHSADWFSPVCLPYAFDAAADCPDWKAALQLSLGGDPDLVRLLQEWFGYLLVKNTDQQKFMILTGEGGNGKSVVCAALEAMLGTANVSHVPLEKFGGEFHLHATLGKLANVCAEIGELDKTAEGTLKQYTAGDPMFFNRKGIAGIHALPTARLLLATNNPPRFSDKSGGMWRRLLLVPFKVAVPEDARVPGMDKVGWWERSGELPGILNWARIGLARLKEQKKFTEPSACRAALDEHRLESNPARAFLLENYQPDPEGTVPVPELYRQYVAWCGENGHRNPLSKIPFGREVRRAFPKATFRNKKWELKQATTVFGIQPLDPVKDNLAKDSNTKLRLLAG